MTLKNLINTKFRRFKTDPTMRIGIYDPSISFSIHPDYADEILETHGDKKVISYRYFKPQKTLVVEFEK